jgi:transposase
MARYDLSEAEWRLIEPMLPNKHAAWRGWTTDG